MRPLREAARDWARNMCAVCNGVVDLFQSERRLGVLKDVAAGLYRDGCRLGQVDAPFWIRMKLAGKAGAVVILPLKSNIKPIIFENRDFDRNDPVNTGALSVDLVTFNHPDSSTMRRVPYRNPETGTEHVFITTEMDLPPGLIAFLYSCAGASRRFSTFSKKNSTRKRHGATQPPASKSKATSPA